MAYKKKSKRRFSASERRAYLIGLGKGARAISGSGKEIKSFERGVKKKAKIELTKY